MAKTRTGNQRTRRRNTTNTIAIVYEFQCHGRVRITIRQKFFLFSFEQFCVTKLLLHPACDPSTVKLSKIASLTKLRKYFQWTLLIRMLSHFNYSQVKLLTRRSFKNTFQAYFLLENRHLKLLQFTRIIMRSTLFRGCCSINSDLSLIPLECCSKSRRRKEEKKKRTDK